MIIETTTVKAMASGTGAIVFLGIANSTELYMLLISGMIASTLSIFYDYVHDTELNETKIKLFARWIRVVFYSLIVMFVSFYILSIIVHAKFELPTIVWVLISALLSANAVSLIDWGTDFSKRNIDRFVGNVKNKIGK